MNTECRARAMGLVLAWVLFAISISKAVEWGTGPEARATLSPGLLVATLAEFVVAVALAFGSAATRRLGLLVTLWGSMGALLAGVGIWLFASSPVPCGCLGFIRLSSGWEMILQGLLITWTAIAL